jgi:hypothetical protein
VETTAEDIRFLGRFQGAPGLEPSEAFSLFIRLWEFCSGGFVLSSGARKNLTKEITEEEITERRGAAETQRRDGIAYLGMGRASNGSRDGTRVQILFLHSCCDPIGCSISYKKEFLYA